VGTTPNRSYPYPESTSDVELWNHFLDLATAIDTDVDDLSDHLEGPWNTYTPSWAASVNPAIGDGTRTGNYRDAGKTVHFHAQFTMGATTTYGTGQWLIGLPAIGAAFATSPGYAFSAHGIDTSAGNRYVFGCELDNTARVRLFVSGGSTVVGAAVPFTWATTDILRISGTYQLA
jgi:hypothetical protein